MTYRNRKLLDAVRDAPCGVCGSESPSDPAHSNQQRHGKGTGIKAADCFVAAMCHACHMQCDQGKALSKEERKDMWFGAFEATLLWLWESGRLRIV